MCFAGRSDLPAGMDPNTFTFYTGTSPTNFRVDNLPHLAESFYNYVTHPRLLAMMEEICVRPAVPLGAALGWSGH